MAVMAVTIFLGERQPTVVIHTIAAVNAVVFGLLGFGLLYLDVNYPLMPEGI